VPPPAHDVVSVHWLCNSGSQCTVKDRTGTKLWTENWGSQLDSWQEQEIFVGAKT